MNAVRTIVALTAALSVLGVSACKTAEPGVKSTYLSQYANVNGNTQEATEAAEEVLQDLELKNVESTSTAVDGYAVGYTADNKKISVDVKKVNPETSEVSVNVGSVGDPDMGTDIVARIQQKLAG